jgi:predicted phage terminase large subunit-like protein
MILNQSEALAIEREACKRKLVRFIKEAWHVLEPQQPYIHNWHADHIAAHLEAVTRGEITRLVMNVPPGTSKSIITSVLWPAWEWGPCGLPHMTYLTASHSEKFSIRDSLKMRRLVESEWFQTRWPIELASDQNEKTKFQNLKLGERHASSAKSLTGARSDRIIYDDPMSVEGARSDKEREHVIDIFKETLPTRLKSPKESAIIVIMQRLHDKDVTGYILSEGLGYEHLCLPMEFDPGRKHKNKYSEDPRTVEGELLFPARFPKEVVDRDKKAMGSYAVAGQFQQSPSPEGGGLFKRSWWKFYQTPPASFKRVIQSLDCAQKVGLSNDYSVCTTWGETDNGYYLLDLWRQKVEAPDLERATISNAAKWNPTAVVIEDKSSGSSLIQSLRQKTRLPIIAYNPGSRDKVTRAIAATPMVESGRCYLPEGAAWVEDFIIELERFPNSTHDDMVDSLSILVDFVTTRQAPVYRIRRL